MRGKLVTALAAVVITVLLVTNPLVADAARQISGRDIKSNTITSQQIKNGTLQAKDFKRGQLPQGPQGPAGADGVSGGSGFRIDENEAFGSDIAASVPVPDHVSGFQFLGTPVTAILIAGKSVFVNAQIAIGSTSGTDVDIAICTDLGDEPMPINTYLTVHVSDRDSFAMTGQFKTIETYDEALFGPCVAFGTDQGDAYDPLDYHPLDDNDWVNGDYVITSGPGIGDNTRVGGSSAPLRPDAERG